MNALQPVVTSPFDYGRAMQQAASVQEIEGRNALRGAQLDVLERRNAFNDLLGSGDMAGAFAMDPTAFQQFQGNALAMDLQGEQRAALQREQVAEQYRRLDGYLGRFFTDDVMGDDTKLMQAARYHLPTLQGMGFLQGSTIEDDDDPGDIRAALSQIRRDAAMYANPDFGAPKEGTGPNGQPVFFQTDNATGATRILEGVSPPPPSGMAIEVGPDGSVSFVQGPGAGQQAGFTKPTRNKVQEGLIDVADQIAALESIGRSASSDFLGAEAKARSAYLWSKSMLNDESLTPDERQWYTNYTTFSQKAIDNLNATIKAISGAATNKQEEIRLKASLPTKDDSPTEFWAKYNAKLDTLREWQQRYRHYELTGQLVNVDQMPQIVERRVSELESAYMEMAGGDEVRAREMALDRVIQEYGM